MVKITQNTQLFPETKDDKFSDALMYFSESLLEIEDEEEILWELAKNCISKLGFMDCVVYLLDESRNVMVQKAAYGPKNPKDFEIYKPVERPVGTGIVGYVAKTGNAELINDTSKDQRYRMDDKFRLSEVCVPIIIDGKVIGIIDCEHPEKNFFTGHHLQMLLTISSICALKIKGVRSHNKYIKQQEQTFRVKKQLVDLKLKALGTQLNPHFVFNTLNSIQYYITSEKKEKSLKYLSTFSKLIRYNLKYLKKEAVLIKDEIDMLNWYLKLQKLRYTNAFEYNVSIDGDLKSHSAKIPSFIIQTLFENLTEYAIFNQHKNQKLNISFGVTDTIVTINIKYRHEFNQKTTAYKPEYRKGIIQWQNQIKLLNKVKDYNIEKQVTFIKKSKEQGGDISLKLPNLK
mgnify:CR=1 FL=1